MVGNSLNIDKNPVDLKRLGIHTNSCVKNSQEVKFIVEDVEYAIPSLNF